MILHCLADRRHIEGPQQFAINQAIEPVSLGVLLRAVRASHRIGAEFSTRTGDGRIDDAGDFNRAQPNLRDSGRVGHRHLAAIIRAWSPKSRLNGEGLDPVAVVIQQPTARPIGKEGSTVGVEGHLLTEAEILDGRVLASSDANPSADEPLQRREFGGQIHLALALEQLVYDVDREPAGSQNRGDEKSGVNDLEHAGSLPGRTSIAQSPSTDSIEGVIVDRSFGVPKSGDDPRFSSLGRTGPLQRVGMFKGEIAILIPVHDERRRSL
jgi:hypothetical protein